MQAMRLLVCVLAGLLGMGCSCGESSSASREHAASSSSSSRHSDSEDYAGGIAWHVEPPLVAHATTSAMRAAEYAVSDHPEATLAVFHFGPGQGGTVDDNIDRWVDQFHQPDGRSSRDVANITRGEAGGLPVTFVDVTGSFSGMRGSEATVTEESQRMLGAIVEGPEGLVFFKLIGPSDVVGSAASAFDEMIASVHTAS